MFFSNLFSSRQSKESSSVPSISSTAQVGCASSTPARPLPDPAPVLQHERPEGLAIMGATSSIQQAVSGPAFDASLSNGGSIESTGSAPTTTLLPNTITLPTTLSIPLDGYCVSVELAPTGPVSHAGTANNGTNGNAVNGLQVQIAQQMLAFATQQATLLQQALPFMLNLPPARVTDKLRGLLTEVQAKPALEKLMKATGSSEPMAQRVCIEYINRNGKGKVDPAKMLAFYHQHKDTVDFSRPLTVQDLLKHMDVGFCIRKIQERLPGIPHQTAELAATLCMADADAAVQLLTASSQATPSALAGPVFLTTTTTTAAAEVFPTASGEASGKSGGAAGTFVVGGLGKGGGSGAPAAATVVLTPSAALAPVMGLDQASTGSGSGRPSVDGCNCYGSASMESGAPGHNGGASPSPPHQQIMQGQVLVQSGAQVTPAGPPPPPQQQQQVQQQQQMQQQQQQQSLPQLGLSAQGHLVQSVPGQASQGQTMQAQGQGQITGSGSSGDPLSDPNAGLDIAGELKQFTDRLQQLQQQQQWQRESGGSTAQGGGGSAGTAATAIMLPPSHIDMLSNLVLQSNAAINRYLLERQQLHKELALLKKHKEWADSRISDLIKKACESDKPFAEEVRSLREEVKRLRADKEGLELKCMEVEGAFAGLKESVYDKEGAKRKVELRLQESEARFSDVQARLMVMEAEAQGAALREAELQRELQEAQAQLKQVTKRTAALERQKTKLQEERCAEAATSSKRLKEVERLTGSLRAAEKLLRERAEAVEAEREARSRDLRAADLAAQTAEAVRISLETELENTQGQLEQAQARCAELERRVTTLQEERDVAVSAASAQVKAAEAMRAEAAEARTAAVAARAEADAAREAAEAARMDAEACAAREEAAQAQILCTPAAASASSSQAQLSRSASSTVGVGSTVGSGGGSGSGDMSAAGRVSFSGSTGSATQPAASLQASQLQPPPATDVNGKVIGSASGAPAQSSYQAQRTNTNPKTAAYSDSSMGTGDSPNPSSSHITPPSSLWGNGHYCAPDFLGLASVPSPGSSAPASGASTANFGQPLSLMHQPPPQSLQASLGPSAVGHSGGVGSMGAGSRGPQPGGNGRLPAGVQGSSGQPGLQHGATAAAVAAAQAAAAAEASKTAAAAAAAAAVVGGGHDGVGVGNGRNRLLSFNQGHGMQAGNTAGANVIAAGGGGVTSLNSVGMLGRSTGTGASQNQHLPQTHTHSLQGGGGLMGSASAGPSLALLGQLGGGGAGATGMLTAHNGGERHGAMFTTEGTAAASAALGMGMAVTGGTAPGARGGGGGGGGSSLGPLAMAAMGLGPGDTDAGRDLPSAAASVQQQMQQHQHIMALAQAQVRNQIMAAQQAAAAAAAAGSGTVGTGPGTTVQGHSSAAKPAQGLLAGMGRLNRLGPHAGGMVAGVGGMAPTGMGVGSMGMGPTGLGGPNTIGSGGVHGPGTGGGGKASGGLVQQGQLAQGLGHRQGLAALGGGSGALAGGLNTDAFGRPLQMHLGPGGSAYSGGTQRQLGHITGPPTNEALLRQLELLRQM